LLTFTLISHYLFKNSAYAKATPKIKLIGGNMNYAQFKKTDGLDYCLLSFLKIIKVSSRIIKINNHPDYDLSPYKGMDATTYYFKDSWSFDEEFGGIINATIKDQRIFHADDIERLAGQYVIDFDTRNSFDVILNDILKQNKDVMEEGMYPKFDEFEFYPIQIERVDHSKKTIHFSGSYYGDGGTIEPMDWDILIECSFCSFASSDTFGKFYVDLISESYSLREAGNLKLAYFLMYAAFENYINEHDDKEGRLKDKLKTLFKNRFNSLKNLEIYTSVINEFDRWEGIRNDIAHGKKAKENITDEMIEGITIFVLTLIASWELKESSFESLSKTILS